MSQLGRRLCKQRPDTHILLTQHSQRPAFQTPHKCANLSEMPSESPADIARFLDHWRPDILGWQSQWLRPGLIHACAGRGIPSYLLDVDQVSLAQKRNKMLPDPLKSTLQSFNAILARNEAAAFRLRRQLGQIANITQSGPLREDNIALSCNETDLEELGEAIKTRPVWLAAYVQADELETVLAAHRAALRLSPRQLLILVPDSFKNAPAFRTECLDKDWRVCSWDDGTFPDENTQILLAEDPTELGLFYRTAPVTFLGSSLINGHGGRNPMEPAALGSAILYGPNIRDHLENYSRLVNAGGARMVKDVDSLAAALNQLNAPDQVAAMVHAGWETVSEGADVTDQLITLLCDTLDRKGAA